MSNPYKIAKMSDAELTFVRWLLDDKGVALQELDINPNGIDKTIEFDEAVAFAMKNMPWQEYMPRLEKASPLFKHPLDDRKYPQQIHSRINELMFKAEVELSEKGILPTDPAYCFELQRTFFELAGPPYHKGGLCLAYDYEGGYQYDLVQISSNQMYNLTSKEFFENCMAPSSPGTYMGSCSENTHARIAVFERHPSCKLDMMYTEQHVYPVTRYGNYGKGNELDASGIGKSGWSSRGNPAAVLMQENGTNHIASMIEPDLITDHDAFSSAMKDFYLSTGLDLEEEVSNPDLCNPAMRFNAIHKALNVLDKKIRGNKISIMPFLLISQAIAGSDFSHTMEFALETLRRWPDNPYVLMPLTYILDFNDEEQLGEACKMLQSEFPKSGWCETITGLAAQLKGDNETATRNFLIAIQKDINNAYALSGIANIAFSAGKYEIAEEFNARVGNVAPNLPGVHMLSASIAQMRGEMEKALEESKREATIFVGNMNAIVLHAQLATATGRPVEAIHLLDGFLKSNPHLNEGWKAAVMTQLIYAYDLYGETDVATGIFNSLLEKDLLTTEQITGISMQIYLSNFQFDEAEAAAELLAQSNPLALAQIGIIRAFKGDLLTAELVYNRLYSEYGNLPLMDNLKAIIEYLKGNIDGAQKIFEGLIARNPYDFGSHSTLLHMYIYKGKINEVRAYYEDLEKTFPNVFYIRSIEPLLDITEGKYLDAKLKSKELLSKKPRSVPLLNYYSLATFKLCELEEAMEAAKLADSILPEDSTAKAIIAAIYLEMGDLVMAEEYAVKALANWIDVDVSSYMDDPITILSKIDAIKIQ